MTTAFCWDYIEHSTRQLLADVGRATVATVAAALGPGHDEWRGQNHWQIDGTSANPVVRRNGVEVFGPGATDDDWIYVEIAVEVSRSKAAVETDDIGHRLTAAMMAVS